MTEKTYLLNELDPALLFGTGAHLFSKLAQAFPRLKCVGRGNEIKISGDEAEAARFEEKLQLCTAFYQKYNTLTEEDMTRILEHEDEALQLLQSNPDDVILYGCNGKPVSTRTVNQRRLVDEFSRNDMLFAVGPAGTGKTYTAIALAVREFKNKNVKRIILTRPAVEAGEKLGFLPGDVKDKLDPYLQPLYDALYDMIPFRKLASYMEDGTIQIAPLAYMRGRTLDNAFVILDEAQNATMNQLKMFLTRMGRNARFIITGDVTQIDLPDRRQSGLPRTLDLLGAIPGISVIRFDKRDIIRHRLVKYIVEAYEQAAAQPDADQDKASSKSF
ncbi:MAG: PhoH family protein [Bacteroidales bacterium]|nr:PhoH family protein [Bacteroidales bacterium]